jgi:oligoendopeptidase F
VEYGLAQLGAVQVWANSRKDYKKAVQDYRQALSLGNTVSLPDLFKAAGAKFAFDKGTIKNAVDLIEGKLAELSR